MSDHKRDRAKKALRDARYRAANKEKIAERKARWQQQNPERCRIARNKWAKANPEKAYEASERWRQANRERVRARRRITSDSKRNTMLMARWRAANPERNRANAARWNRENYQSNVQYRIRRTLRRRLGDALKGGAKSGSAVALLGCTTEKAVVYLEAQWTVGMSWETHGHKGWQIDHIVPLSAFDLENPTELVKACHYTNLQPLWWDDNMRKGDKVPKGHKWTGTRWIGRKVVSRKEV